MHQLTQTTRINRSRHTGRPVLEELNTFYGYYATTRFLTEDEYAEKASFPAYNGPMHLAEAEANQTATCG